MQVPNAGNRGYRALVRCDPMKMQGMLPNRPNRLIHTPNTLALVHKLERRGSTIYTRPYSTNRQSRFEEKKVMRRCRRSFWNVRVMRAGKAGENLRGPRPPPSCRMSDYALSRGSLHVCDACRENRPLDAQRAYGVLVHHCAKTFFSSTHNAQRTFCLRAL